MNNEDKQNSNKVPSDDPKGRLLKSIKFYKKKITTEDLDKNKQDFNYKLYQSSYHLSTLYEPEFPLPSVGLWAFALPNKEQKANILKQFRNYRSSLAAVKDIDSKKLGVENNGVPLVYLNLEAIKKEDSISLPQFENCLFGEIAQLNDDELFQFTLKTFQLQRLVKPTIEIPRTSCPFFLKFLYRCCAKRFGFVDFLYGITNEIDPRINQLNQIAIDSMISQQGVANAYLNAFWLCIIGDNAYPDNKAALQQDIVDAKKQSPTNNAAPQEKIVDDEKLSSSPIKSSGFFDLIKPNNPKKKEAAISDEKQEEVTQKGGKTVLVNPMQQEQNNSSAKSELHEAGSETFASTGKEEKREEKEEKEGKQHEGRQEEKEKEENPVLTIVSLNVGYIPHILGGIGGDSPFRDPIARAEALAEEIKKEKPDAVNLQEVFDHSEKNAAGKLVQGLKDDSFKPTAAQLGPNRSGCITLIKTPDGKKDSSSPASDVKSEVESSVSTCEVEEISSSAIPFFMSRLPMGFERWGDKGHSMTHMAIKEKGSEGKAKYFITNINGHQTDGGIYPWYKKAEMERKYGSTSELRNRQMGDFNDWSMFLDETPPTGSEELRFRGSVYTADTNNDYNLEMDEKNEEVMGAGIGISHGKPKEDGMSEFRNGAVKYEHRIQHAKRYPPVKPANVFNLKANSPVKGRKGNPIKEKDIERLVHEGLSPGTDMNSKMIKEHHAYDAAIHRRAFQYLETAPSDEDIRLLLDDKSSRLLNKLNNKASKLNTLYFYLIDGSPNKIGYIYRFKERISEGFTDHFKSRYREKLIQGILIAGESDVHLSESDFSSLSKEITKSKESKVEVPPLDKNVIQRIQKSISLQEFNKESFRRNSGKILDIVGFRAPKTEEDSKIDPPQVKLTSLGHYADHTMVTTTFNSSLITAKLPEETETQVKNRILFNKLVNQVKRRYLDSWSPGKLKELNPEDEQLIIKKVKILNQLLEDVHYEQYPDMAVTKYEDLLKQQIELTLLSLKSVPNLFYELRVAGSLENFCNQELTHKNLQIVSKFPSMVYPNTFYLFKNGEDFNLYRYNQEIKKFESELVSQAQLDEIKNFGFNLSGELSKKSLDTILSLLCYVPTNIKLEMESKESKPSVIGSSVSISDSEASVSGSRASISSSGHSASSESSVSVGHVFDEKDPKPTSGKTAEILLDASIQTSKDLQKKLLVHIDLYLQFLEDKQYEVVHNHPGAKKFVNFNWADNFLCIRALKKQIQEPESEKGEIFGKTIDQWGKLDFVEYAYVKLQRALENSFTKSGAYTAQYLFKHLQEKLGNYRQEEFRKNPIYQNKTLNQKLVGKVKDTFHQYRDVLLDRSFKGQGEKLRQSELANLLSRIKLLNSEIEPEEFKKFVKKELELTIQYMNWDHNNQNSIVPSFFRKATSSKAAHLLAQLTDIELKGIQSQDVGGDVLTIQPALLKQVIQDLNSDEKKDINQSEQSEEDSDDDEKQEVCDLAKITPAQYKDALFKHLCDLRKDFFNKQQLKNPASPEVRAARLEWSNLLKEVANHPLTGTKLMGNINKIDSWGIGQVREWSKKLKEKFKDTLNFSVNDRPQPQVYKRA